MKEAAEAEWQLECRRWDVKELGFQCTVDSQLVANWVEGSATCRSSSCGQIVGRIVDDLQKFGRVRRGSIGYVEVLPMNARLAEELRAPKADGIVVNQMSRDSAAYRAGLEPGDIIVAVNGTAINIMLMGSAGVSSIEITKMHRIAMRHFSR